MPRLPPTHHQRITLPNLHNPTQPQPPKQPTQQQPGTPHRPHLPTHLQTTTNPMEHRPNHTLLALRRLRTPRRPMASRSHNPWGHHPRGGTRPSPPLLQRTTRKPHMTTHTTHHTAASPRRSRWCNTGAHVVYHRLDVEATRTAVGRGPQMTGKRAAR